MFFKILVTINSINNASSAGYSIYIKYIAHTRFPGYVMGCSYSSQEGEVESFERCSDLCVYIRTKVGIHNLPTYLYGHIT